MKDCGGQFWWQWRELEGTGGDNLRAAESNQGGKLKKRSRRATYQIELGQQREGMSAEAS